MVNMLTSKLSLIILLIALLLISYVFYRKFKVNNISNLEYSNNLLPSLSVIPSNSLTIKKPWKQRIRTAYNTSYNSQAYVKEAKHLLYLKRKQEYYLRKKEKRRLARKRKELGF